MERLKRIYDDGVAEIENYLRFVLVIAEGDVPGSNTAPTQIDADSLRKTLKATTILVLYNLMEATLRESIQAIFDELKVHNISYDDCSDKLKRVVLKNHKRRNVDKIRQHLDQIAIDIVHKTFNIDEVFSGNVDGRLIRETAEEYGFKEPSTGKYPLLLTIKNARNDLAHGVTSFSDLGKDLDRTNLEDYVKQVKEALQETIENVQEYINTKAYRKTA